MFSGDGRQGLVLNITPGIQSCGTPPKTWLSLIRDGFCVHFSVEPLSNRQFWGHPSWELPCFKTAKHAISRVWPSFLSKSRGASDSEYLFVFHVSWELLQFVIQHVGYIVIFLVSRPGSFHSKMTCLLELSTGKLQKCQKDNIVGWNPAAQVKDS